MKIIDYPNVLLPERKVNKEKVNEISKYCSLLRTKYNIKIVNKI